jgi:hypothetical protein
MNPPGKKDNLSELRQNSDKKGINHTLRIWDQSSDPRSGLEHLDEFAVEF